MFARDGLNWDDEVDFVEDELGDSVGIEFILLTLKMF